ncbi:hypothetical protein EG68_09017 [Paragonimus skrjabini miyazakii]|uniref:DOCKER Lobe A domain-containing protein n=1 Tax=Paragonimus skrjabini miyazakii TaxID=59628 RepID=A0A8S9YNM8_9TREM|nr:hypothetical protein EG68_09017 [Paragonimus skrjabini miyazakii]
MMFHSQSSCIARGSTCTKFRLSNILRAVKANGGQLAFLNISGVSCHNSPFCPGLGQPLEKRGRLNSSKIPLLNVAETIPVSPLELHTWLGELAELHKNSNSLAEFAMIKLHIAALIAEHLKRRGIHLIHSSQMLYKFSSIGKYDEPSIFTAFGESSNCGHFYAILRNEVH